MVQMILGAMFLFLVIVGVADHRRRRREEGDRAARRGR